MGGRLGFPVMRDPRHRFKDVKEYLRRSTQHEQFCQAVAKVSRTPDNGDLGANDGATDEIDVWKGFPWLTPVIGSGALELPVRLGFDGRSLGEEVANLLDAAGLGDVQDSQGETLSSLARTFAESLVSDRLQAPSRLGSDPEDRKPVELLAARLALIAALATRFFHLVRAFGPSAMCRSGREIAAWDRTDARFATREPLDTISDDVLAPLDAELGAAIKLLRSHPSGDIARAVSGFLDDVRDRLDPREDDPRELNLDDLRLLTEIAWFFLIQGTQIYPGWSDLLLGLLLVQKGGADEPLRAAHRPRPKFMNLSKLADSVKSLMKEATEASWMTLENDRQLDERDQFFAATADVLWEEARARRRTHANQLPPAVAFVTSFDMELEMALWTAADIGDSYSIVLPIHVRLGDSPVAEPFWLIGTVVREIGDADHGRQLLSLQEPSWRVLPANPRDNDPLFDGPVVVHLSGCPLYDLRRVAGVEGSALRNEMLETLGLAGFKGTVWVDHAVMVDEYLALRQSATELFLASQHQADSEARWTRGLPVALTRSTTRNVRFWMALGVAVGDPAIRHRLVSQMSIQWLRNVGGKAAVEAVADGEASPIAGDSGMTSRKRANRDRDVEDLTDVHGLAVNRRIDDEEASLLYWLGLDVVEDECQAFVRHLRHYSWHLEKGVPMSSIHQCQAAPR